MLTKVCSKCKVDKPHSEYFKDKVRKIGIRCKCKACCKEEIINWREKNRSEYNDYAAMWRAKNPDKQHKAEIKRRYGLSIEDYNKMLVEQECKCAICGKQHNPTKSRGRLFVDHDHKTGKLRQLLCGACNSALGYFLDDTRLLAEAIAYIVRHRK